MAGTKITHCFICEHKNVFSEEIKRADSFLPGSFANCPSNLLSTATDVGRCSAAFDLESQGMGDSFVAVAQCVC